MDMGWLTGVTGFAIAMAATPGPNNTMVAASGATFGMMRSLPLNTGIGAGVGAIMLIVSALGSAVITKPSVGETLKWLGVLYLLWLAWKIASAEPVPKAGATITIRNKPLSFIDGALFQLVNPKLWVMVSGAVVAYGQGSDAGHIGIALVLGAIFGFSTFVSVLAWTMLGASVGHFLSSRRAVRIFNIVLAGLLVVALIPIVLE